MREENERIEKKGIHTAWLIVLAAAAVLMIAAVVIASFRYGGNTFIMKEPEVDVPLAPIEHPVELPLKEPEESEPEVSEPELPEEPVEEEAPAEPTAAYAAENDETWELDKQVYSTGAILIDAETNTVICEKDPDEIIYPASMTKIMTALVACEQITDWDDTFTMTQAIIDEVYVEDLTMAGYLAGEDVNMQDLLYGAILPSGAEATTALANYIAGSEEGFVALMNEKAQQLGLTTCHFTDASGLHNEEHRCTIRDIAVILQAALANERCREVLSAVNYTSSPTPQNPNGVSMSNKFLVLSHMQELGGAQILAAKTGFTTQAGNCCASFGVSPNGRECICVTANALESDFAVDDHVALYSRYADPAQ